MEYTKLKSQRELDVIKGKVIAGAASADEVSEFAAYVEVIEGLISQARSDDSESVVEWCDYAGVSPEQLAAKPVADETEAYFEYATALEKVLDEADCMDFFGTEGWRHRIGTED